MILSPTEHRKHLWHVCRHCNHCRGAAYEDEQHLTWDAAIDCKLANRDVVKDKEFAKCPLGKWAIGEEEHDYRELTD